MSERDNPRYVTLRPQRQSDKVLLDLCCKAGGAAMGYHRAGWRVIGVDIERQPHYPFEFRQADALTFPLDGFDAIHASPPCQAYSETQRLSGRQYPELIEPIRERLIESALPYVIENVPGSPLIDPVMLCGAMFPGLYVYRHRLFETNWPLDAPDHPAHLHPQCKMGRPPKPGEFIQVVGNYSGAAYARMAMGIDWMSRNEMAEAIPPAYTEWIGRQLLEAMEPVTVAGGGAA